MSFYCESCYHLLSDKKVLIFNEDVKNLLEETSDKNIFKYGNIFLIIKYFNNNLLNFGEFLNFDDALDKKTEIEDNGWPIPMNLIDDKEETISNNIFKRDGKYHVFNIVDGKKKIFGKYSSKKEATIAKYSFIKNNWGKSKDDGLPKYIYTTAAGTFSISRRLFGKEIRFGTFSTLEDAIFVKSLLNDKNWKISNFDDEDRIYENDGLFYIIKKNNSGKLKIFGKYDSLEEAEIYNNIDTKTKGDKKQHKASKYGTNIYKTPNGLFRISKSINGNNVNFAYFEDLKMAQFVRKILEQNDWNVDYFIENNIFKFEDTYVVLKLNRSSIKLMGVFDSLEEAKKFEDDFDNDSIMNHAVRFVYKIGDKFVVQRNLKDGTFQAKFNTLEAAIAFKDYLESVDWHVDLLQDLNNILQVGDKFIVFVVDNLRGYQLAEFNSKKEALVNKERLIGDFKHGIIDNKKFKTDKHIYKSSRGYSVVKRIDGTLTSFGTFNTREEAIGVRDELIANNWNLNSHDENSDGYLNSDVLNEIIFRLNPWEKIVFDAINELNSDKFTFDDLKQFENKFKRFTTPDKIESKILKNLDGLTEYGLLVKSGENSYRKLWNY